MKWRHGPLGSSRLANRSQNDAHIVLATEMQRHGDRVTQAHSRRAKEQELNLARLIQLGTAESQKPLPDKEVIAEGQHAKDLLFAANLDWLLKVVDSYSRRSPIPREELIGLASLAMSEVIERFDPQHGVRLKTFAERHVRGRILNALDEHYAVVERTEPGSVAPFSAQATAEHHPKPLDLSRTELGCCMDRAGDTDAYLAHRFGVSERTIKRSRLGEHIPQPELMAKFEAIYDRIKCGDLWGPCECDQVRKRGEDLAQSTLHTFPTDDKDDGDALRPEDADYSEASFEDLCELDGSVPDYGDE